MSSGMVDRRGDECSHDALPPVALADVKATDGPNRNVVDASGLGRSLECRYGLTGCDPAPADGHVVAKGEQPRRGTLFDRLLHVGSIAGDRALARVNAHRRDAPAPASRAA